MAYPYYLKLIVSGNQVEMFNYKQPVWRDFTKDEKKKTDVKKEPKQLDMLEKIEYEIKKMEFSVQRTKTQIKRMVNSNPELNKFMTLTFADSMTDLKQANYLFNQFAKRMSYRFPDFEYLAVPEFQKDIDFHGRKKLNGGSIHYHLLCNLPYIEMNGLEYIWGQGAVNIRKIGRVNNLGSYMSKYLGKELFNGRMFNKKKFFRSQTLKQPVELISWYAMMFANKFLSLIKPVFETKWESEWTGEVEYKAYNLGFVAFSRGVFERSILMNSQ